MREYDTGATRSELGGKLQYEGYLSPAVLQRFAQYMKDHQTQEDGKPRKADNWQSGIPIDDYMDSMLRHVMDTWLHHRGHYGYMTEADIEDVLCALMFNVMGYLYEEITTV